MIFGHEKVPKWLEMAENRVGGIYTYLERPKSLSVLEFRIRHRHFQRPFPHEPIVHCEACLLTGQWWRRKWDSKEIDLVICEIPRL